MTSYPIGEHIDTTKAMTTYPVGKHIDTTKAMTSYPVGEHTKHPLMQVHDGVVAQFISVHHLQARKFP